jgi:hypothetical protein
VYLQGGRCRVGRRAVPQLVDQPIAGDRFVGMEQQEREQRSLFRAAERDRTAVLDGLQRPEDPELDGRDAPPLAAR